MCVGVCRCGENINTTFNLLDKMHTQGSSKQNNNKTELSTHHNGRRGHCITTEAIMYQYFIALSFPRTISTSSD